MALVAVSASMITVCFLIGLKVFAYIDNGSASVLASLVDSIVDASVSVMMFLAVRLSLKPADEEHRSGHGKVEGLAALMQAAFIAGAGFFLLLESIKRFSNGMPPGHEHWAIAVMGVSTVCSLVLIYIQKRTLQYAPSLAVEADHAHYSMDIFINVGVILILLGLRAGAPAWIDPAFGVVIAAYLAVTVRKIAGQGIDMLLDRELPQDVRDAITKKVMAHPGVMGMHDLRTNKSGMDFFISFDIELDPSLLLYTAHEIVRAVEHELLKDFPNAEILIHADPYGDTQDTRHRVAGVHDRQEGA